MESTLAPPSPHLGLPGSYVVPSGVHDEYCTPEGVVRPQWKAAARTFAAYGSQGIEIRQSQLARLVREHGIAYNVYAETGAHNSWSMDLFPLIIDEKEWDKLAKGLSQRFHLLNLTLADCYGSQHLIAGGKLPPSLVFGHSAYLPACQGLIPPSHSHLRIYSADLGRSPDGRWWVMGDSLDAASGFGYALENRELSQRVVPEAVRDSLPASLDPFVQHFCEAIEGLAPRGKTSPHVVLLTPGRYNETYFEHTFLARNLGFSLVEAQDLTVRDDRVFLKTINGLQPVDVILRRTDSVFVDPLELDPKSVLGVPGLLQAVRAGNVSIANSPGCGFLESPAFPAFLPGISRAFLGEDLLLPSVASWWCGQPKELKYVLKHLDRLVVRPARNSRLSPPIDARSLSPAERETLAARIVMSPDDWCAHETVAHATTPALSAGMLQPAQFSLRVYMVRQGGRYHLLPGGLARYATGTGTSLSMQHGSISKDVWILPSDQETPLVASPIEARRPGSEPHGSPLTLTATEAPTPGDDDPPIDEQIDSIRRASHSLPSRLADNLFWLGRYLERADSQARLLRVLVSALLDEPWGTRGTAVHSLLAALIPADAEQEENTDPEEDSQGNFSLDVAGAQKVLTKWFRGPGVGAAGLPQNLTSAVSIARQLKERLSMDAWQAFNGLETTAKALAADTQPVLGDHTLRQLDRLISDLSCLDGIVHENMTRGHGWQFQDIGCRLERSLHLSNLIYSTLGEGRPHRRDRDLVLQLLLRASDSLITYRRRYFAHYLPVPALDLLISDPNNPRALIYQVERIRRSTRSLPHFTAGARLTGIDCIAASLVASAELTDLSKIAPLESYENGRPELRAYLDDFCLDLRKFSNELSRQYFTATAAHVTTGK